MNNLVITRITPEADDVVSVELRLADGGSLPRWEPGAHLELHLPSGLIRQYSLCSDPGDDSLYRVAVLRVADGRGGSREIHDADLTGQHLTVAGPRNHFPLVDAPDYLLIAGGIGVTPLLAMARELTKRGKRWSMVYGGRTRKSMAFLDELAGLGGVVDVVPEDEQGRPDLAGAMQSCEPGAAVYCCGPEAMLDAAKALCEQHLDDGQFHSERFAASTHRETPAASDDSGFQVRLARSGKVLTVPSDRSVLDVVLGSLPRTQSSCREGFCGTCEVKVLSGTPDHRDDVLTDAERARNDVMMMCISRSLSPVLELDL